MALDIHNQLNDRMKQQEFSQQLDEATEGNNRRDGAVVRASTL